MRIEIRTESDIVASRTAAKAMAREMGFGVVDQTMIATAISELTRNIVNYAGEGLILMEAIEDPRGRGLEIICEDRGPGIKDIAQAMQPGFSTGRGLGMGLSGTRRLMDEFEVTSETGRGTRVVARKWLTVVQK